MFVHVTAAHIFKTSQRADAMCAAAGLRSFLKHSWSQCSLITKPGDSVLWGGVLISFTDGSLWRAFSSAGMSFFLPDLRKCLMRRSWRPTGIPYLSRKCLGIGWRHICCEITSFLSLGAAAGSAHAAAFILHLCSLVSRERCRNSCFMYHLSSPVCVLSQLYIHVLSEW